MSLCSKACLGARPCVFSQRAQRPGRRAVVTRASAEPAEWSYYSSGSNGGQAEEHWASLFAASYMPATNNPATVEDARDALESCGNLWGEQRSECLSIFGLDANQLDTFYSTVLTLEHALQLDTDPEEEAMHRGQERC